MRASLNSAALAGAIATFPRSLVLLSSKRLWKFPQTQPRNSGATTTEDAEIIQSQPNENPPTMWGLDFAFGMMGGALYASYRQLFPQSSSVSTGLSFGVLTWVASRYGWLPNKTSGLPEAKTQAVELTSELLSFTIWGVALGVCYETLNGNQSKKKLQKTS